jgi:hypothetical protein
MREISRNVDAWYVKNVTRRDIAALREYLKNAPRERHDDAIALVIASRSERRNP